MTRFSVYSSHFFFIVNNLSWPTPKSFFVFFSHLYSGFGLAMANTTLVVIHFQTRHSSAFCIISMVNYVALLLAPRVIQIAPNKVNYLRLSSCYLHNHLLSKQNALYDLIISVLLLLLLSPPPPPLLTMAMGWQHPPFMAAANRAKWEGGHWSSTSLCDFPQPYVGQASF